MGKENEDALIVALQNRILGLETKLEKAEKESSGKSYVEVPALEAKIEKLKLELKELYEEKKKAPEPVPSPTPAPKKEPGFFERIGLPKVFDE